MNRIKSVIIIYGSTIGNTKQVAEKITEVLKKQFSEVLLKNVRDASVTDLKDYDLILFGSSTWGDGELQYDFVEFEENLQNIILDGKKVAIFGTGMSTYPIFCGAVDILEETAKNSKAEIVAESLKIDWGEGDELKQAEDWAIKSFN